MKQASCKQSDSHISNSFFNKTNNAFFSPIHSKNTPLFFKTPGIQNQCLRKKEKNSVIFSESKENQEIEKNVSDNVVQRQAHRGYGGSPIVGFVISRIAENVHCLSNLESEMRNQTHWFLRTACEEGNYLTTLLGVRYISESRADAFGHCWIACMGTRVCGENETSELGHAYEYFREAMRIVTLGIWEHNSYEEDTFNQRRGRELAIANPTGDCSRLCYDALVNGELRFHSGNSSGDSARPLVYLCRDITLNGHLYHHGWRTIPMEYLERF